MYKSTGPLITYNGDPFTLFPFFPNYRRDFIERYEWATNVLQSYDGTEQRVQLREFPRRTFEYELFAAGSDRAAVENFLFRGNHIPFAVPAWNWGSRLTSSVLSATIPVDPTYFTSGFAVGYMSPTDYDLEVVSSVGTGVNLAQSVSWNKHRMVYPVMAGFLNTDQSLTRITGNFTTGVVTFNLVPHLTPFAVVPAFTYYGNSTTPGSFPVVDTVLNERNGVKSDIEFKVSILDPKTTAPYIAVEGKFPIMRQSVSWFLNGRPSILKFLNLIHYCAGRCLPFWMPTHAADFIPVYAAGTQLGVVDSGYSRFVLNKTGRRFIQVLRKTGVASYHQIVQSSANTDGTETLVLDTPLNVDATGIRRVSFLNLVRFENDRIELAFKGPTFAESSNQVRILPI